MSYILPLNTILYACCCPENALKVRMPYIGGQRCRTQLRSSTDLSQPTSSVQCSRCSLSSWRGRALDSALSSFSGAHTLLNVSIRVKAIQRFWHHVVLSSCGCPSCPPSTAPNNSSRLQNSCQLLLAQAHLPLVAPCSQRCILKHSCV